MRKQSRPRPFGRDGGEGWIISELKTESGFIVAAYERARRAVQIASGQPGPQGAPSPGARRDPRPRDLAASAAIAGHQAFALFQDGPIFAPSVGFISRRLAALRILPSRIPRIAPPSSPSERVSRRIVQVPIIPSTTATRIRSTASRTALLTRLRLELRGRDPVNFEIGAD